MARGDHYEDSCSESPDEPKDDEPGGDEPKDESDHTQSCEDGPVAGAAHRSKDNSAKFEDGCLPQFVRRFVTRVWKFVGEVDYYEAGELSMTLGKILNLPRKWRTQDDELLDSDATVLVSNRVRVFEGGERVSRDALGRTRMTFASTASSCVRSCGARTRMASRSRPSGPRRSTSRASQPR